MGVYEERVRRLREHVLGRITDEVALEGDANPHTPATRKWYMFELDSLGAKYAVTDRLDTLEGLYNSAKEG